MNATAGLGFVSLMIPGAIIGLMVLGIVLGLRAQKRRAQLFAAYAASQGWTYIGRQPDLAQRWRGYPFNQGGSSKTASDVILGTRRGRSFVAFTYSYTTSSGKSSTTHHVSMIAVDLGAYLPELSVGPEGMFSRLFNHLGGQDIQFESEEFNHRWRVLSPDQRFAYGVVHPRFMEWLMRPGNEGLAFRLEGPDALTWESGRLHLPTIAARVDLMVGVRDSIPQHVWQDYAR